MERLPRREEFFKPVLQALDDLGGSGTIEEINLKVANIMKVPSALMDIPHKDTSQTEFEYEMAWVRTMLKNQGLLENSKRGVWAISSNSSITHNFSVSPTEAQKIEDEIESEENWKEKLIEVVIKNLSPNAFERLVQRMLREKGFAQVEVTGRSGDGGIDGRGIAKINGILSFHIIFQCKRYSGKVSAKEIRDFRGAMVGRTDKGLFITTGAFTRQAMEEASRDGAPVIDLIDGDLLAEKLKELGLGVKIEIKEEVTIDEVWFKKFESF